METTSTFSLALSGNDTQKFYTGDFKLKTLLTRKEQFRADQYRRDLLGPNPESAMPQLIGEAFMVGQLTARLVEMPDWFRGYGLDLLDSNIISEVFEKSMAEVEKKKQEFKDAAAIVAEGLKKL